MICTARGQKKRTRKFPSHHLCARLGGVEHSKKHNLRGGKTTGHRYDQFVSEATTVLSGDNDQYSRDGHTFFVVLGRVVHGGKWHQTAAAAGACYDNPIKICASA
jgi:hypothetical protein